jgi:hypothetical protein
MNRRNVMVVGALVIFTLCVVGSAFTGTALAQYGEDIMVSFESNSGWILSKETRKLMFFRYVEPDEVWTSNTTTLPSNIDLTNSVLKCVGSRGNAVFLYDRTSGIIHFFQALKDRSILQYVDFSAKVHVR